MSLNAKAQAAKIREAQALIFEQYMKLDELHSDLRSKTEERSERWQESEAGQKWEEWLSSLEERAIEAETLANEMESLADEMEA